MGIYLPNMEMPQDGVTIIEIHSNGATFRYSKSSGGWEKLEDPVPVPPHGDLIDRDEQIERAWRLKLSTRELIEEMLKSAPAIIPAEEGE